MSACKTVSKKQWPGSIPALQVLGWYKKTWMGVPEGQFERARACSIKIWREEFGDQYVEKQTTIWKYHQALRTYPLSVWEDWLRSTPGATMDNARKDCPAAFYARKDCPDADGGLKKGKKRKHGDADDSK